MRQPEVRPGLRQRSAQPRRLLAGSVKRRSPFIATFHAPWMKIPPASTSVSRPELPKPTTRLAHLILLPPAANLTDKEWFCQDDVYSVGEFRAGLTNDRSDCPGRPLQQPGLGHLIATLSPGASATQRLA